MKIDNIIYGFISEEKNWLYKSLLVQKKSGKIKQKWWLNLKVSYDKYVIYLRKLKKKNSHIYDNFVTFIPIQGNSSTKKKKTNFTFHYRSKNMK